MTAAFVFILMLLASPGFAQEHQHDAQAGEGWHASAETNVFFGYNYQLRKFTDFDEVESQNWLMTSLSRSLGGSSNLRLIGMFSFEPFTLRKIGSPQVFQTGETYQNSPLIDYQHPHDLFMNVGAEYTRGSTTTLTLSAYVVGPAPLGPTPFMHRPSAADNPQSPLAHHYLDSTHISPGVVAVGVARSGFSIEAGAFHGREPDEDRLDLDTGALDSFSVRGGWAKGPWSMQISGAHLKTPERKSPYDENRITASASYFNGDGRRSIAWTAAFGQNREVFGTLEAFLFEGERVARANTIYTRIENVDKDILDAGFHPIGIKHTHRQSNVTAFTVGYLHDVIMGRWGKFGVGGDITGYLVPANLEESYGSPLSFHVFIRLRARAGAAHKHS